RDHDLLLRVYVCHMEAGESLRLEDILDLLAGQADNGGHAAPGGFAHKLTPLPDEPGSSPENKCSGRAERTRFPKAVPGYVIGCLPHLLHLIKMSQAIDDI